jgi:carbonic anhydrase
VSDPPPFTWAPFGPSAPEPRDAPTPPPAPEAPPAAPLSRIPARRLAVVTCVDPRIDPLALLGLRLGDAHVIRNAGAMASDDVIRSLHLSLEVAGTETVVVMGHADCAAFGDDDEARAELLQSARRVAAAVDPDGSLAVEVRWFDPVSGTVESL